MNVRAIKIASGLALALIAAPFAAQAGDSGFLSDASKLTAATDNQFEQLYLAPDAQERSAKYTAFMVDQPEVFVHPDSKYKGMKPDDMKALADGLREAVIAQLKDKYQIVNAPGPNVAYLRLAVSDVMLQKKKRPILAYTPVGAVVKAAKDAVSSVASKADLKSLKMEGEVLDSTTQYQLAAMTATRGGASGGDGAAPASWKDLNDLFTLTGKRIRCRIDNAAAPKEQWHKCGALTSAAAGS